MTTLKKICGELISIDENGRFYLMGEKRNFVILMRKLFWWKNRQVESVPMLQHDERKIKIYKIKMFQKC